jgi:hypothetical protein
MKGERMLTPSLKSSVQIRIADGGYIIQWMEPKATPPPWKPPEEREPEEEEKPAYLKDEHRRMHGGFRPWIFTNPNRCLEAKLAVRVELASALELVGQILGRLEKFEKDMAGH